MDRKPVQLITLICIWMFGLLVTGAHSWAEATKIWHFHTDGGTVTIQLAGTTEAPSLEILYGDQAHPSLAEVTSFIQNVLKQLPSTGVDPSKLRGVFFRGFAEPDIQKQVASASLDSKEWKSRNAIPGGAERALKDLLNATGTYDAFNAVFKDYGLGVKVAGVEKVSSSRCSELGIPDINCSIYHNPRLPTGGNIFLSLVKQ